MGTARAMATLAASLGSLLMLFSMAKAVASTLPTARSAGSEPPMVMVPRKISSSCAPMATPSGRLPSTRPTIAPQQMGRSSSA